VYLLIFQFHEHVLFKTNFLSNNQQAYLGRRQPAEPANRDHLPNEAELQRLTSSSTFPCILNPQLTSRQTNRLTPMR
jgi:hypothetical protein